MSVHQLILKTMWQDSTPLFGEDDGYRAMERLSPRTAVSQALRAASEGQMEQAFRILSAGASARPRYTYFVQARGPRIIDDLLGLAEQLRSDLTPAP